MRAHSSGEDKLLPVDFSLEERQLLAKFAMDLLELRIRAKAFTAFQAAVSVLEDPEKKWIEDRLPVFADGPEVFNKTIVDRLEKLKSPTFDGGDKQKEIKALRELLVQSKDHLDMWEAKVQDVEKNKLVPKELKEPAKGRMLSARYLRQISKVCSVLSLKERKKFLEKQLEIFETKVLTSRFWQNQLSALNRQARHAKEEIKAEQLTAITKKNADKGNTWHVNILNDERFYAVINNAIGNLPRKKSVGKTEINKRKNADIEKLVDLLAQIKNLRNKIVNLKLDEKAIEEYLEFSHVAAEAKKILSGLGLTREFKDLDDLLNTGAAIFQSVKFKEHHEKELEFEEFNKFSKDVYDAKVLLSKPDAATLEDEVEEAENCSAAISLMGNIFRFSPDLSSDAVQESMEAGLANASASVQRSVSDLRAKIKKAGDEVEAAEKKISDAKLKYGFTVRVRVGLGMGSDISEALSVGNAEKEAALQQQMQANEELMTYLQKQEELEKFIEEYALLESVLDAKEEKKKEEEKKDDSPVPLVISNPEDEFEKLKIFAEQHDWAKPMVAMLAVFGAGFGFDMVKNLDLRTVSSEFQTTTTAAMMSQLEKDLQKEPARAGAAPSQQTAAPPPSPRPK